MDFSVTLLNRLRTFVENEAKEQYASLTTQWDKPLAERVAKGYAIEGVNVERIDKKLITLSCATNESRFREGDLLVMHQGDPKDANALHVELQYDGEMELEVSLIKGEPLHLSKQPVGWIIDQDWFDSSPFYLGALASVADSLRGRTKILPLLQGSLHPKTDYAKYERVSNDLAETNLNDSQVDAIANAYATDLLHLIQGPPGTGKTQTLANIASLLVRDGKRVLVTALTHRAIHNALNKIIKVDPDLNVCKIGVSSHAGILDVPCYESFTESGFVDISDGYVIGATPFAVQTNRLANVEFDVVLFDEASQVTLPLTIMGMLAGNKYIFIGDENQLPPVTILSAEQANQTSIFSYLAGHGNETMLNITYRLNDILAEWPSKQFYEGKLVPSPEAAKHRLKLSNKSTRLDFILDPTSPVVFIDICNQNTTIRSHREAELVVELILALLEHQIPAEEIGVVVPYRAQSRLTRSLLRRQIKDEDILSKVAIDTVERMQGQEREIILVSFTTASPAFASQMADFLFQPQRLNVAVTRPKAKLILIGSHHMLSGQGLDQDHEEIYQLLKNLLDSGITFTIPDGLLD